MNFNDVVKLIMKETGKGYAECAQILDKAIRPMFEEWKRYELMDANSDVPYGDPEK